MYGYLSEKECLELIEFLEIVDLSIKLTEISDELKDILINKHGLNSHEIEFVINDLVGNLNDDINNGVLK